MMPLSDLSDAELEAIAAGDTAAFMRATAQRHGVRPELVGAVMHQESRGNQSAVSPKGARGRMQLMPATAKELEVDPDDEFQNIEGGVRYLGQQIKDFGDEAKGLAAYNAGPGAVRKYGGVPPFAETQGYVRAIQGASPDITSASDEELLASLGEQAPKPKPPPLTGPLPVATTKQPGVMAREGLGFAKGVAGPIDRLYDRIDANPTIKHIADITGQAFPAFGLARNVGAKAIDQLAMPAIAEAEASGVEPGKLGEFAGNVAVSLPSGATGMRSAFSGALTGGLMSEKDDPLGILGDAALGGVAGRLGDAAAQGGGALLRNLLSKAPKVMDLPTLEAAKKAAYKAVDDSGFVFSGTAAKDAATKAQQFLEKKGGKTLYPEAALWVNRLKTLASQKGGLPLSQLDDLRGDIYTALVKPGGKDSVIGSRLRQEIDDLIATAGKDNDLIRAARDLNLRWSKANLVNREAQSGALRAEKDYGGDFGRKVKDRVFPLIDPANPKRNLRGATKDEIDALTKIATGTKLQNLSSTAGGMLDPRRLGGKILTGITATGGGAGAPLSGGLSLLVPALQMAAGFGLTGAASKTAQKNVNELLRLIAVGGSKEALKKVPTGASRAAEKVTSAARPAVTTAGTALVIQPQPKKRAK